MEKPWDYQALQEKLMADQIAHDGNDGRDSFRDHPKFSFTGQNLGTVLEASAASNNPGGFSLPTMGARNTMAASFMARDSMAEVCIADPPLHACHTTP